MQKSETAELVIYAQSIQGREATKLQIEAWHTLLAEVDFETAIARARRHFAQVPRDLWPADILAATPDDPAVADDFAARRDMWLSARGITYDEYLEHHLEPGWLESLERRASS